MTRDVLRLCAWMWIVVCLVASLIVEARCVLPMEHGAVAEFESQCNTDVLARGWGPVSRTSWTASGGVCTGPPLARRW